MSITDIIRAWKDETFREGLKDLSLPEHPSGQIELSDASLNGIQGGLLSTVTIIDCSWNVCTMKSAPEICG
jgi:mersacidin/lichenicidin family type 2 lantibiotic